MGVRVRVRVRVGLELGRFELCLGDSVRNRVRV